jgi:hypothetical protein
MQKTAAAETLRQGLMFSKMLCHAAVSVNVDLTSGSPRKAIIRRRFADEQRILM